MKLCVSLALLTVAAALLLGTAVGVAGEAGERWRTEVKLSFDPRDEGEFFEGKVSSGNPKCERARKVVVRFIDGNERIGSDKTNARGFFEVKFSGRVASGTYKAVAKRAEFDRFVCKSGKDTVTETHDD